MHANVNIERKSWNVPPDDIIQVADPRSKKDQVSKALSVRLQLPSLSAVLIPFIFFS